MHLLWEVLQRAVPLITHGNPYLFSVIWFTIQVAAIATAAAAVIGLPIGLAIGLGRFRGRQTLHVLANASLALPPVVVGFFLFLLFVPEGPLGSLHLTITRRAVFIAQTVLALPYVVALSAAAVQGLPGGLVAQARLLGAGRLQVSTLALREARIGIVAALLAALGTGLAEVGAIVIVGGNVYGYDQTLASAALYEANAAHYDEAVAISIVLIGLILVVMVTAGLLQQQGGGIRMRFRAGDGSGVSAGAALLECRDVSVRRGDREVVRDVSFELRSGELVALLGPNGAGKSTLLDALGGALAPAEGEIVRHGRVATALQAPDLARRSVVDNVKLALAWWGVPRAERARASVGGAGDDAGRAPGGARRGDAVRRRAAPRSSGACPGPRARRAAPRRAVRRARR